MWFRPRGCLGLVLVGSLESVATIEGTSERTEEKNEMCQVKMVTCHLHYFGFDGSNT